MTAGVAVERVSRDIAHAMAAFALGLALLMAFLLLAGFDVGGALAALWRGAFGSWYAFTSATLVRATPLLLLGLAFTIGGRAGALNIGMEGQFAAGAIAAVAIGVHGAGTPAAIELPLVLAGGLVAGAAWIAIPVILRARFEITEVISTLLLNFVASAMVSYAVTGPLQEASRIYPQSAPLVSGARLPHLGTGSRLHLGFPIALAIAAALALVLNHTRWGFRLRAVGAGGRAAHIVGGINTTRVIAVALLWSGALAGLGGAVEVSGVSFALYQNLSPGYGFTAIAVALLGRMRPALVVVAAIMFGALEAGAGAMQRDAAIPAVGIEVVEAVVIVAALILAWRRPR
ncbi:MAG TPA: ABC transporter permease [Gemmatimonadales bacterium]